MVERRLGLAAVALVGALAGMLVSPTVAAAAWRDSAASSSGMSVATATLASASGTALARGTCILAVRDGIVVTWTASTSTFATGYDVQRATSAGGPFATVASVSGRTTTSYTDAALAFSTTYHYRVVARTGGWTSPPTSTVSMSTRSTLCVV